jgi:hypothetical protein
MSFTVILAIGLALVAILLVVGVVMSIRSGRRALEERDTGQSSFQEDFILLGKERSITAHILIKQNEKYISVACSINGWMDHVRFFSNLAEAQREYSTIKAELLRMTNQFASDSAGITEAISEFVQRFANAVDIHTNEPLAENNASETLAGDPTTNAPPPAGDVKKKRKGK